MLKVNSRLWRTIVFTVAMLVGAAILSLGSYWLQLRTYPPAEAAVVGEEVAAQSAASNPRESEDATNVSVMPMGSVCWAAILEAVSSYGKRCVTHENRAFRVGLNEAIHRLDGKFLGSGWSEERLGAFKRQMGEEKTPTPKLCSNADALGIYRETEKHGSAWLLKTTDDLIARPGPPQWGTCL